MKIFAIYVAGAVVCVVVVFSLDGTLSHFSNRALGLLLLLGASVGIGLWIRDKMLDWILAYAARKKADKDSKS